MAIVPTRSGPVTGDDNLQRETVARRPDRRRGSLNASFFSNVKAFVTEHFCRESSSRSISNPSS